MHDHSNFHKKYQTKPTTACTVCITLYRWPFTAVSLGWDSLQQHRFLVFELLSYKVVQLESQILLDRPSVSRFEMMIY